jgi:hypothetical protein
MKIIYPILILWTFTLKIFANPVISTYISFSELYFDHSGNWELELEYFGFKELDSVFLVSTTDSIKLSKEIFPPYCDLLYGLKILTRDLVDTNFNINRQGDRIKLIQYSSVGVITDYIIFGNYPGASIGSPREGQSICRYRDLNVIDKSPTIGNSNDTLGIKGTLKGTIYGKYSNLVAHEHFYHNWIDEFETSGDGKYSIRTYARPVILKYIVYHKDNHHQTVPIEEISYDLEPDSVIERNIHLLDELMIWDSDDQILNTTPFKLYPNPVAASEKLLLEIDLPVKTSDIWIEITGLDGKLIRKEKVRDMETWIDTPDVQGIFILNVLLEQKIIASGKIVITSE